MYSAIEKRMVSIALQYYQEGKYKDFFETFHPEIVILSVGKGQLVVGKDNAIRSFAQIANPAVQYDVLKVNCKVFPMGSSGKDCCGVLMMDIIAHYPDGRVHQVNQRITANWHYCVQTPQSKYQMKTGWYVMNGHASVAVETETKPQSLSHISKTI